MNMERTGIIVPEVEWIIKGFFKSPKGSTFYSPIFTLSNARWSLKLSVDAEYEDVFLYLVKEDQSPVNAEKRFELGVKFADGGVFDCIKCTFRSRDPSGSLKGGTLTDKDRMRDHKDEINRKNPASVAFFCRVTHEDDTPPLIQNFSDMYLKQQLCDVTIKVGDRKFQAHRAILASHSTVFAAMFEHDMTEMNSGVIKIDDCDPDAFHHFLLYLYSAKVDIISPKNAVALYCIADKYDVPRLRLSCEQFLSTNLSVELFCEVLVFAKQYEKPTLIKDSQDFFARHTEEILVTEQWQHFLKEHNVMANELFVKCAQAFKRRRMC